MRLLSSSPLVKSVLLSAALTLPASAADKICDTTAFRIDSTLLSADMMYGLSVLGCTGRYQLQFQGILSRSNHPDTEAYPPEIARNQSILSQKDSHQMFSSSVFAKSPNGFWFIDRGFGMSIEEPHGEYVRRSGLKLWNQAGKVSVSVYASGTW